ncbi:Zn-dependent dipeptidase, microsomal dipeptidase [Terriglobus roseus DSM 18391]|uniref:Zn-dependent dipeptidase, microsomal dipeptidase n=1 Tax=Terriglobus roseus (strain DSM 18391 / NRRL B-41598 / KBS 63) TaxID=926566 RepID=I3ZDS1_TERRK|nr:dipeptidase [Terriglobus roseus]AFL87389.1 Zn-dependent dipeptidase, microsomal dipeptidase [Terriglobus roseus DSM 18391]
MEDFLTQARALHAECIVLDGHADTPQRFVDDEWNWTGDALGLGQLSAETARAGGLDGGFLIAWPEPEAWAGQFADRTRKLIAGVHMQAARHPAAICVCRTPDEIRSAKADACFAAMIGVEGGHAIENSLEILREFYTAGARYMTLTWANANDWCGSSGGGANPMGLTAFGREVIAEMNWLGMMVDVSHVSDASFWDVLEASRVPVIASHSSVRRLCEAPRNLTDEMALALAAKGGVVMVNFFAAFLSDPWRAAWNAQKPELLAALDEVRAWFKAEGRPVPFSAEIAVDREFAQRIAPVPFSVLVDHFDHLLRLVGPEHVGIGSDFDGIALSVEGMETAADLPKITAGLLERGWKAEELRGMLGENLLRVMTVVQDGAGAA